MGIRCFLVSDQSVIKSSRCVENSDWVGWYFSRVGWRQRFLHRLQPNLRGRHIDVPLENPLFFAFVAAGAHHTIVAKFAMYWVNEIPPKINVLF